MLAAPAMAAPGPKTVPAVPVARAVMAAALTVVESMSVTAVLRPSAIAILLTVQLLAAMPLTVEMVVTQPATTVLVVTAAQVVIIAGPTVVEYTSPIELL